MGGKVESAFPLHTPYSNGLTKREWFAGQALAGIMVGDTSGMTWGDIAAYCYNIADAMITKSES